MREGYPNRPWREAILAIAGGHREARVLLSAAELGIFEPLAAGPVTAEEVAGRAGLAPEGTRILLDALAGLGIATVEADRYRLAPGVGPLLRPDSEESLLPYLRHLARSWRALGQLSEVVRRGPGRVRRELFLEDPEAARDFALGMHALAFDLAERVVARLDLAGRARLLDLGAGSGAYSIAALRAWPGLRATLVDRPVALDVAAGKLEHAGVADRAELVPGDYLTDPLPAGHDAVLLSAVLHQHRPAAGRELVARAARALEPGGLFVIRDFLMAPDRTRPRGGAVFAAAIHAATGEGRTLTEAELRAWMGAAGISKVRVAHRGGKESLLVGTRA